MRRAQAEFAADWLHAGIDAYVCPGDSAAERLVRSGWFGEAGRRTDGRPPLGAGVVRALGILAGSFGEAGRILPGSWPEASVTIRGRFEGLRAAKGPSAQAGGLGAGAEPCAGRARPEGALPDGPGRSVPRERGTSLFARI